MDTSAFLRLKIVSWFASGGAAVLLFGVLYSPVVWGQNTENEADSDTDVASDAETGAVAKAREAYATAVQAYEERRYKDAIDLFLQADQLSPNPAFSFNVGIAYEDMGDPALALRYYRSYIRQAPQAADRDDVDARIERLEAALQEKGVQQVTVLSTPQGATVAIDGRPVGVTPWTGEIAPGHHRVALQLRGYEDDVRDFDLPPSRSIDVPVTLSRGISAGPGRGRKTVDLQDTQATRGSWYQRVSPLSWIVLGAGVSSLGVAAGFEIARGTAEKNAEKEPVQLKAEPLLEKAQSRETMALSFGIAGGALTLAGGVLAYLDITDESDPVVTGACESDGCYWAFAGHF